MSYFKPALDYLTVSFCGRDGERVVWGGSLRRWEEITEVGLSSFDTNRTR